MRPLKPSFWGPSSFDRRHVLSVYYIYDLPFGKDQNTLLKNIAGGWQISGATIFRTGTPFSVTDSGAGTAFLGAGFTPGTLSGSLASGSTLATALTTGRRSSHAHPGQPYYQA